MNCISPDWDKTSMLRPFNGMKERDIERTCVAPSS